MTRPGIEPRAPGPLANTLPAMYLEILKVSIIKQVEMKEKNKKRLLQKSRKLQEAKFSCKNLIKGIDTWEVPLVRFYEPFLKWTKEEIGQMNLRTRKSMTSLKALNPRDDTDWHGKTREEDSPALKNALIQQSKNSKNTLKGTNRLITRISKKITWCIQ